jgi:HEXXH motif-containing protein
MPKLDEVPDVVAAAALTMGPGELVDSIAAQRLKDDLSMAAALLAPGRPPPASVSADVVLAAPGRGGVRFGARRGNAGNGGWPEVDPLFLAEVACASGLEFACEAGIVHFPAAGMTLPPASGEAGRAAVKAAGDGITVTTADHAVVQLRPSSGGPGWHLEQAAAGPRLSRTDEYVGGLRFVKHGYAITSAGGPDVTAQTGQLSPRELDCVREAVAVLDRTAPEFLAEIQGLPLSIVPLRPRPGIIRQSLSHRMLPGVVYSSVTSPAEFIDLVCHEYHHLKLFAVDSAYPLLDNPSAPVLSPWRSQTRTVEGLLHAIFVFFQLTVLFDRIFEQLRPSTAGLERMATWLVCMDIGLKLLAESDGQVTSYGAAIAARMEDGTAQYLRKLHRSVGDDMITRLRQEVDDHLTQAGDDDSSTPRYLF